MAERKAKVEQWAGDRSYAENGRPQDAPCPKCGEQKRVKRKSWDMWLNYCYSCHTMYTVFPELGDDGKMVIAKPKSEPEPEPKSKPKSEPKSKSKSESKRKRKLAGTRKTK